MAPVTPPPLQGPSSKEKKYDRQLRLWAASGQVALEESHILLINSGTGVTGVEALKNLILPGIGQFTVLDASLVTEADLGINFFLEADSIGKFRATETCRPLKELNPDVEGHHITEPLETFISNPDALQPYTVIVASSPIDPSIFETLTQHCFANSVPLFLLHSVGFYSQFFIQLPSVFPIVDTHPDPNSTLDLRVLNPWPALQELAEEKARDLGSQSDDEHSHIPYVLLLIHYVKLWKDEHGGKVPEKYGEKSQLRDIVRRDERMKNAEGGEENFREAAAAVLKTLSPPTLSSNVREVFDADECRNITAQSANFWIIAHAIWVFYKKKSVLPLPGSVPDMRARSADYIQLQNVYKTKAREDFAAVLESVRALETQLGRQDPPTPEKEVEEFCKSASSVRVLRGRKLYAQRPGEDVDWRGRAKAMAMKLTDPDSLILIYIAFLAYDIFTTSHLSDNLASSFRAPGSDDSLFDADTDKLTGIASKIVKDLFHAADSEIGEEERREVYERAEMVVKELVRAGGAEMHNIASLTGGLVAQEVIKVVTKQYVPVDNTCVFDGVESKSAVLKV